MDESTRAGARPGSRSDAARERGDAGPVGSRRFAVPFPDVGTADVDVAGGKGANLGELVRAGFAVPDGFVVPTAAYALAVRDAGLAATISEELAQGSDGAAIRSAVEHAPIPAAVADDVAAAYDDLGGGPVAVRSSATAEDLPGAASAGQQDTYLGVAGTEEVLDAVRRCWASLWTDRAIAYRQHLGIGDDVVIAVVVQRMAGADVAGVMFTADPVTGDRSQVVVDAAAGLGEAVVSPNGDPGPLRRRHRRPGPDADTGGAQHR